MKSNIDYSDRIPYVSSPPPPIFILERHLVLHVKAESSLNRKHNKKFNKYAYRLISIQRTNWKLIKFKDIAGGRVIYGPHVLKLTTTRAEKTKRKKKRRRDGGIPLNLLPRGGTMGRNNFNKRKMTPTREGWYRILKTRDGSQILVAI